MDRQTAIENLLDHYQNPRHKHRMDDADIQLGGGNPGCGDLITIYLKIGPDETVEAISFEGEGCTISQAGGSILTEMVEGMTLDEVKTLGTQTMFDEMGEEVVRSRVRCATLALGTLQAAVDQLRQKREHERLGLAMAASEAKAGFEN